MPSEGTGAPEARAERPAGQLMFYDPRVEIFKSYVETAERNIDRRHASNRYFFSLMAGVFVAFGFILRDMGGNDGIGGVEPEYILGAVASFGFLLSLSWFLAIRAFRRLSASKYQTIIEMEQSLPFQPHEQEWQRHKRGRRLTPGYTTVESIVPLCFMAVSLGGLAVAVMRAF